MTPLLKTPDEPRLVAWIRISLVWCYGKTRLPGDLISHPGLDHVSEGRMEVERGISEGFSTLLALHQVANGKKSYKRWIEGEVKT